MKHFYEERASRAADRFARTDKYKEQCHGVIFLADKLTGTLTENQRQLFIEYEEESNASNANTSCEIYKAGFLDGIALGFIGATHFDEINETYRESFHTGYIPKWAARTTQKSANK